MTVDNLSANSFLWIHLLVDFSIYFIEWIYFNYQLKNILTPILVEYMQKKTEEEF